MNSFDSVLSVPVVYDLCPLWMPQFCTLNNAPDEGGRSDQQVSGSMQEGGGHAQSFSEKQSRVRHWFDV